MEIVLRDIGDVCLPSKLQSNENRATKRSCACTHTYSHRARAANITNFTLCESLVRQHYQLRPKMCFGKSRLQFEREGEIWFRVACLCTSSFGNLPLCIIQLIVTAKEMLSLHIHNSHKQSVNCINFAFCFEFTFLFARKLV